jgi:hypothetical protein
LYQEVGSNILANEKSLQNSFFLSLNIILLIGGINNGPFKSSGITANIYFFLNNEMYLRPYGKKTR